MPTPIRELAQRVPAPHRTQGPDRSTQTDRDQQGSSFQEELQQAQEARTEEVHLSKHAEKRIQQREISFDALEQQSVSEAMGQLSDKGARDALLLRSDAAFLVNVPNRTVVTAMDRGEMSSRMVTDIDSAYMLDDQS